MNSSVKRIAAQTLKLVLTSSIALLTGYLFRKAALPAPFLLGSLLGVWFVGGLFKPMQPYLGIPRGFHVGVVLGLGTIMGATFQPDMLLMLPTWLGTVSTMLVATLVATAAGYSFLRKKRAYEPELALLCALPGGQAEVLVVARELVEKDYVVALCHLIRVATVFCATPLILGILAGREGVSVSNELLAGLPGLQDLEPGVLLIFLSISMGGFLIAKAIKIPMPHLLGPLLLSATLHLSGLVNIPRIYEFVLLAQVAIGGAVGARLAQVSFAELSVYIIDAILVAFILISVYVFMGWGISLITGIEFIQLFLAFVPGGLYEVTLLAFIFGFDVAFIAFHHTVRVLILFISLPFIAARLK